MNFIGSISSSKSLYNRALIAKSFASALEIEGQSAADDVKKMKEAVLRIGHEDHFDCGEAGTVLRFLALRLSREEGDFHLKGSSRLFSRPQDELIRILSQLGVRSQIKDQSFIIESRGWRPQGDTLMVPCGRSSQFLSAVALSSWNLPFDLYISPENFYFSRPYFYMTQRFLEKLGMRFRYWSDDFCILKEQKPSLNSIEIEADVSSCFAIAAAACVSGTAVIQNFPVSSVQPDVYFLETLRAMGASLQQSGHQLKVSKTPHLSGVHVDLKGAPDLFPVLSALCARARGPSELRGAPHLQFKESSRISKVKELLLKLGCLVKEHDDGLSLEPPSQFNQNFEFDPEDDHRLAMAAGVLLKSGIQFQLLQPQVVKKSFPEFWSILGVEF